MLHGNYHSKPHGGGSAPLSILVNRKQWKEDDVGKMLSPGDGNTPQQSSHEELPRKKTETKQI